MKKLQLKETFSQRDPRWSGIMLGNNTQLPYTIGNYGCLLTVLTIYLCALGRYETPVTLQDKLRSVGGFTPNSGEFIWNSLVKVYGDIAISYQSPRYTSAVPDNEIENIKRLIDAGGYVITEIDFNPSTVSEEPHYVGIYGYSDTDFYIIDPWTGSTTVLSIYGDIKRVVYRFTVYSKPLQDDIPVVQAPSIDWSPLTAVNGALTTPQAAADFIKNLHLQIEKRDTAIQAKDIEITKLSAPPVVQTQDEKFIAIMTGISQVLSKSDVIMTLLMKDPTTVVTKSVPPPPANSTVSTLYNTIKTFMSLKWK